MLLKELRRNRALTIAKLAELSGVSEPTIMRIEAGRSRPTLTTIGKLAAALDVEPKTLLPLHDA